MKPLMKAGDADLSGRVCVVTGANTGMGKETAQALVEMGATVVLACRSVEKGEAAKADILRATGKKSLEVMKLDVASLASVRQFAAQLREVHPAIHVLVNNAAAWWMKREVSVDKIELQWATNVVGPFLLTQLLTPLLIASGRGRVVNVSSTAAGGLDLEDPQYERKAYSGVKVYSAAKQANRMLSWALARRLQGQPVTVNADSPGLVNTELNRNTTGFFTFFFSVAKLFARTPRQGADTTIWLAASPEVEGKTGAFWVDRKETPCKFRNDAEEDRLWAQLEALTGRGAPAASRLESRQGAGGAISSPAWRRRGRSLGEAGAGYHRHLEPTGGPQRGGWRHRRGALRSL